MRYVKKVSVGQFLKRGEDIKDGDVLIIANEGKQTEGEYGLQDIFLVKTKDGKEGNVNFNRTSLNGIIDAYGEDSVSWIGKSVKAIKVKQNVAGKFIDVWYFSHPEAELTENGFVMPFMGATAAKVEDNEIKVEDIPF